MGETAASEWRPMLWPREWTDPGALRLVAGSPVNCLVLPQPDAAPWKPLAAEARRAGLDVIAAAESGAAAPEGVRVLEGGVWPKVARARGDADATDAGPTGLPWIDSNGWRIQLARARFPDQALWARFDPPGEPDVIRPSAYGIAVADCEAYGARWLISLDGRLRDRLTAGNSAALNTWKRLLDVVSFFRDQAPAAEMRSAGVLAALSDFAGDNEFLGHEFLNLVAREYVPVRILLKSAAVPSFEGLRMIVYLDRKPLEPAWKSALAGFVRSGGALITDRVTDPGFGTRVAAIPGLEYDLRRFGRGRVAVAQEEFQDPWRVAADAQVLLGRAHDLLRQANAGSMGVSFAAAPGGKQARLHLVNYSGQPGLNPVTLTFLDRYRTARFRSLEHPAAEEVPVQGEYERSAVYLPPFAVCGTVELQA